MWLDRLCICWWMFCAMDNISFKTIRLEPGPLGCHGNWQNMEWLHSVNMITVHDYEINLWCFAIGWPGPRVPSIISWEKKTTMCPFSAGNFKIESNPTWPHPMGTFPSQIPHWRSTWFPRLDVACFGCNGWGLAHDQGNPSKANMFQLCLGIITEMYIYIYL